MDAIKLAHIVITHCQNIGNPISNLQLQKILFYIQRAFLVKENKPAFDDEIEAWQFGPVVPSVYYKYCAFGANRIKLKYLEDPSEFYSKAQISIIRGITEACLKKAPWDLVEETHNSRKSWAKIFNSKSTSKIIPKELIKRLG